MELVLHAPQHCVVHQWFVAVGDAVAEGQVLFTCIIACDAHLSLDRLSIIPQLLACLLPIRAIDESVKAAAAAAAVADKMNEEAERSVRLLELRNRCFACVMMGNRAHVNVALGWLHCRMLHGLRLSLSGEGQDSALRARI